MAREHARIWLSIWDNPDFTTLATAEQNMYFKICSSPDLSYCGVALLLPKRYSRLSADSTDRATAKHLQTLAARRFLVLDEETAEMCVRTYIRYDGILKQPNVIRAMNKAFERVQSEPIRNTILEEVGHAIDYTYPSGFLLDRHKAVVQAIAEGFAKGFVEGLPEPFFEVIAKADRKPSQEGSAEE